MEVLDACVGLKGVLNEVDSEVASRRRLGLDQPTQLRLRGLGRAGRVRTHHG